jgi:hypothetical protein
MQIQTIKFRLVFTLQVQKQLDDLSSKDRKQYDKAFECFANNGPSYRSLRTHRYRCKDGDIWSSFCIYGETILLALHGRTKY